MKNLFLIFLFGALLFSCREEAVVEEPTIQQTEIENLVEHAQFFELEENENGFLLTIIDPETKKNEVEIQLSNDKLEKRSILIGDDNFALLSQTSVGMLGQLDATDRISAISGGQYLSNQILKSRLENGTLFEIGDMQSVSVESILKTKSNVILYNGFGNDFPKQDKLEEFGVICIPLYDWRETSPLGKAEWIKLMGVLTGKIEEASEYFSEVESEYNRLKEIAKSATTKPTILSGNKFGDIWYAPAGESFNAEIFKDAQLNYVFSDSKGTGSIEKTFEQIIAEASDADFWLNPGMSSKEQLLQSNPKLNFIKAFPNNTYCYSAKMNEFWELSAMNPHWVLHDLISIAHSDLLSTDSLYFYQKITD